MVLSALALLLSNFAVQHVTSAERLAVEFVQQVRTSGCLPADTNGHTEVYELTQGLWRVRVGTEHRISVAVVPQAAQVIGLRTLHGDFSDAPSGPFANPDDASMKRVAAILHRTSGSLGEEIALDAYPVAPNSSEVKSTVLRRLQGANVGTIAGFLSLDKRTGYVTQWVSSQTFKAPLELRPRITVPEAFQIAAQAVFSRPELKAAGRILALPDEDYPSYRPVVCLPGSRGTPIPERYKALKEQGQSILAWELPLFAATPEGGVRSVGSHWVGLIDAITGEVVSVGYMALGGKPEGVPAKPLDVRNFEAGRVTLNGRAANVEAFSLVPSAPGDPTTARVRVLYVGPRVAFSCEWDGADRVKIGSSEFTAPQVLVETLKKLAS